MIVPCACLKVLRKSKSRNASVLLLTIKKLLFIEFHCPPKVAESPLCLSRLPEFEYHSLDWTTTTTAVITITTMTKHLNQSHTCSSETVPCLVPCLSDGSSTLCLSSVRELPAQLQDLYQQGFSLVAVHPFIHPCGSDAVSPQHQLYRAVLIRLDDGYEYIHIALIQSSYIDIISVSLIQGQYICVYVICHYVICIANQNVYYHMDVDIGITEVVLG